MFKSILTRLEDMPLTTRSRCFHLGHFITLWTFARLPLLALSLYYFSRDDLIWLATLLAIHLMGTLPERAAIFGLILVILSGSFLLSRRFRQKSPRYFLPLLVSFGVFLALFYFLPGFNPFVVAFVLTGVLGLNIVSDRWLVNLMSKSPGRQLAPIFFAVAVGLVEFFLLKPWFLWIRQQWWSDGGAIKEEENHYLSWLPGTVLTAILAALFLNVYSVTNLHRTIYPDPSVRMFATGDFNWLALDKEQRTLFVSGHGINYLRAYNLDTLDQPFRESPIENGYAQSFAYNPEALELYVYNELTQTLLFLDASTLALKKSIPLPQISPGDAWMVWDKFSDSIIIASEADEQRGSPTVVINRTSGQVLDTVDIAPGNISLHPTKPLLYMAFFRRDNELFVYDTLAHKIVKNVVADEQLNRMTFANSANGLELLIASPADSAVLRLDAGTLEHKGVIKCLFGTRSIAVDPIRNLLLCGSLVTHRLEVIDLATRQPIAEYYIGPWLRTITLDSEAGLAYISTHEGLFLVRYID